MFTSETPPTARSVILALTWIIAGSLSLQAQTTSPNAKVEPITGSISGRVVNESGQGIPNVMVYTRPSLAFSQRATATDSEGNFKFDGLDSALYLFSASAPGYVMPARDPEAEAIYYRLSESVTLNLIKGGVITGTVLSSSGEPVVQVPVRAMLVRDANGKAPKSLGFQTARATDDRGIYRLYGLAPGTYVVSAGGRNSFGGNGAYGEDAPTYAPSSTRDTAAQISVSSGDETTVDIKYRGEPGHAVSGTLTGTSDANLSFAINVSLMQFDNGAPINTAFSFTPPGGKTFAIYGVADGEYDLTAQSMSAPGDSGISETRNVTVKGADVTGIELNIKPLGSISGHVVLAKSEVAECKNKRQPLFSEMVIAVRRSEKLKPTEAPRFMNFFGPQAVPNQTGDFRIRNLGPGQYNFGARFFARYWYLKSIAQETGATVPPAKTAALNNQTDLARNGVTLKFGESISRVRVNLAEGAASLRGSVKLDAGQTVPSKLFLYLVPAEKDNAEDVLRFFVSEIGSDGTFAFNNLPPGRYWTLGQVSAGNETQSETKLRLPDEAQTRERLRRAAEAGKLSFELKPCQNASDYQVPVSFAVQKN
jgi:Carboxypeptidase regulatory-like domain